MVSTSGPTPPSPSLSLRDQRRAELRQKLSDTATALFLERGFDAVTVADVARACGVTEKTVFNHFRSKESLLVDRWEAMVESVRSNLGDPGQSALEAVVATLHRELDALTEGGGATQTQMATVTRFGGLIASTPALRDHRSRSQEQLTAAILDGLAERRRTDTQDPETQVIAEALSGLFTVFYRSLGRHASAVDAAHCRDAVRADIQTAATRLAKGVTD
jgi:AcrR family transcriptional regulator